MTTDHGTRTTPCGHSPADVAQGDEGTAYCAACEREARQGSSPLIACVKCCGTDIYTRWHGKGAYHPSRRHASCSGDYGETNGKPKDEHLHHVCRCCGWAWTEPPRDAS